MVLITTGLLNVITEGLNTPRIINRVVTNLVMKPYVLGFISCSKFVSNVTRVNIVLLVFSTNLKASLGRLVGAKPITLLITFTNMVISITNNTTICLKFNFNSNSLTVLRTMFVKAVLTTASIDVAIRTLGRVKRLGKEITAAVLSTTVVSSIVNVMLLAIMVNFGDPSIRPTSIYVGVMLFFILTFVLNFTLCFLFG